jgi:hypothetical protein
MARSWTRLGILDRTMKAIVLTLIAATVIGPSSMSAQSNLQTVEVNQILADPDRYRGQVVALHGVADSVKLEHRTFTIVDVKAGKVAAGTSASSLPASLPDGSRITMPKPGQETIVIGQIEKKDGVTGFLATQVFTNRVDVQQILAHGSIKSGKRPGDNLGRDARPSGD